VSTTEKIRGIKDNLKGNIEPLLQHNNELHSDGRMETA
jgi:hypothetical protein